MIPHMTKSALYLFIIESSQKVESSITIDINNTGIYRKWLASFIPMAAALYISNVLENIKIAQINRVFETVNVSKDYVHSLEGRMTNMQMFKQDL